MCAQSTNVLEELAKRFKGKLASCNVYDANVCSSRGVPGKPWELIPVSGEPFSKRLRFTYKKRKVTLLDNGTYVHGIADGSFASRPFTINAKQKAGFRSEYADDLSVGDERYPVFTEDGHISSAQKDLLSRGELMVLVAQSDLREGESLHFTRGEIGFYVKRRTAEFLISVIDRAVDLAVETEYPEEPFNMRGLPVQFRPLAPLIAKWALPDDSERNDLLETTSRFVLSALVTEVDPYLHSIDSYLDSFRDSAPSEEAVALGRLAEVALEAKQRLTDKIP